MPWLPFGQTGMHGRHLMQACGLRCAELPPGSSDLGDWDISGVAVMLHPHTAIAHCSGAHHASYVLSMAIRWIAIIDISHMLLMAQGTYGGKTPASSGSAAAAAAAAASSATGAASAAAAAAAAVGSCCRFSSCPASLGFSNFDVAASSDGKSSGVLEQEHEGK